MAGAHPHLLEVSPLAVKIYGYLLRHPEAMDTLQGIAEWWLLDRAAPYPVLDIEAALVELIGAGAVKVSAGPAGILYRLNKNTLRV